MLSISQFEEYARKYLPKNAYDYYRSGADEEQTLKENEAAFKRLRLRPRMLRNVSQINLSTTILGEPVAFPIGIAPSAMQRMAHPDGEIATARAAARAGTLMILSTLSTTSIEDVAKSSQNSLRWFQLYIYEDREITRKLVLRAERCGYKAIVLTVDAPYFGIRRSDVMNNFTLPPHLRLANFDTQDNKSKGVNVSKGGSGIGNYIASFLDHSITWDDIKWLRSITKLPIVVKGIMTAEDATIAKNYGINAIVVSNHGARQLDGVPATIEVLPEIVKAVGNECEIYLDGGVRMGTDVIKALSLGARAVFIGRPILWGLAFKGEEGVYEVLKLLKQELSLAMTLSGCASIKDIKPELVVKQSHYSSL